MHIHELCVLFFLGRDADLPPQGPRQNQTQTRPCRAAVGKDQVSGIPVLWRPLGLTGEPMTPCLSAGGISLGGCYDWLDGFRSAHEPEKLRPNGAKGCHEELVELRGESQFPESLPTSSATCRPMAMAQACLGPVLATW